MTPPNVALYNWIHQAFDFRSRSTRSDYWWPRLFVVTINIVLLFIFVSGLGPDKAQMLIEWLETSPNSFEGLDIGPLPSLSKFALTAGVVFGILTFIPDLSVSWRRFQDMEKPGFLHILFFVGSAFVPFALFAQYIWFAFPGTRGPNRYGPDKLSTNPDVF